MLDSYRQCVVVGSIPATSTTIMNVPNYPEISSEPLQTQKFDK